MAVPKRRTSRRTRNNRRSHHALKAPILSACKTCGALILPHRVCHQCGHFKEQEIVKVENY